MIVFRILHYSHSNPSTLRPCSELALSLSKGQTLLRTSLFRIPVFTGMSLPLQKQGCFAFRIFSIRNLHLVTTSIEPLTLCVFDRSSAKNGCKNWFKKHAFWFILAQNVRTFAHFWSFYAHFSPKFSYLFYPNPTNQLCHPRFWPKNKDCLRNRPQIFRQKPNFLKNQPQKMLQK